VACRVVVGDSLVGSLEDEDDDECEEE